MINAKNFKEAIQQIKDEDIISDYELAQRTGLSVTAIKKILKGKTESIHAKTLRKIAQGTGRKIEIKNNNIYFIKKKDK